MTDDHPPATVDYLSRAYLLQSVYDSPDTARTDALALTSGLADVSAPAALVWPHGKRFAVYLLQADRWLTVGQADEIYPNGTYVPAAKLLHPRYIAQLETSNDRS